MTRRKKPQFQSEPIHKRLQEHPFRYLQKKSSFWIATMSLVAFVAGNMVGQHGWRAFWASVIGGFDDTLIAYTGTVTPIEFVPDYSRWIAYGGDPDEHTFRQVPKHLLVSLPEYIVSEQRKSYEHSDPGDLYSIGNLGTYSTGEEGKGSHPGVDIRLPMGTPIRSIANGIVTQVRDSAGFGKVIVIRHPHMPRPQNPEKTTVLYSVYAHLSAQYVSEGEVMTKGHTIGLSGQSGNVTGPHLHFQIDRDEAPWHPYWPFTGEDLQIAGLSFTQGVNQGLLQGKGYENTVHPMLYVQANYNPVNPIIARSERVAEIGENDLQPTRSLKDRVSLRREQRVALMLARRAQRLAERMRHWTSIASSPSTPGYINGTSSPIRSKDEVAQGDTGGFPPPEIAEIDSIAFQHDKSFSGREWEDITVRILDKDGNPVSHPHLPEDIFLKTAYGDAEFEKQKLSVLDFKNGEATIRILPRGRRTVVLQALPYGMLSPPIRYEE